MKHLGIDWIPSEFVEEAGKTVNDPVTLKHVNSV
jgi:hypothetical protein